VDALRARKRELVDVKVYTEPEGGHEFDRLVAPIRWEPRNGRDQQDSWARVWRFFGTHLANPPVTVATNQRQVQAAGR
jgi:hypothetical protein